jgi:hypothetical protein
VTTSGASAKACVVVKTSAAARVRIIGGLLQLELSGAIERML